MTSLPARAAYRLWAASYDEENAVSFLENHIALALAPATAAHLLLDAGCGTGRRFAGAHGFGVDLSPEMLRAGVASRRVAAADLRALPFPDRTFDLVWCRLAVGHVPELDTVYAELARVCDVGGTIFVSDFHPAAAAAGHRRTFRDVAGSQHEVEHVVHPPERHAALARRHGLELRERRDGAVGPIVEPFYTAHGMAAQYREQRHLPLVLALLYVRSKSA